MGIVLGIVYLYIYVCNEFMNDIVILKMWCGIDIFVFVGRVGESDEIQCSGCFFVLYIRENLSCGDIGNFEGEYYFLYYQDYFREIGKIVFLVFVRFYKQFIVYR